MKDLKVRFNVLNFPSRNKFRKWLDLGQECDLGNCGQLKPYGISATVYYEERIPYKVEHPAQIEVTEEMKPLPILSFLYRKALSFKVTEQAWTEDKFRVCVDLVAEGFSVLHPKDRFNPNFGKMTALQDLLDNYETTMSVEEIVFVKNLIAEYAEKIKPHYTIIVFKETLRDKDTKLVVTDETGRPVKEGYNYKEKFETESDLLEWMFHEEPENYLIYKSLPGGKVKIDIVRDDTSGVYSVA